MQIVCYTKGVGKETGSDSLKGSEMVYSDNSNVRLDEFNRLVMNFVLEYGCQLSVSTSDSKISNYRLSKDGKWALLFTVHPSGTVLNVYYNFMADACNYDVFYDIKKSPDMYGIGNYDSILNSVKVLMAKNFIKPVKTQ